ncbi:gas vesicle protein [Dactylosporangium sp. NPDC049525]|uniref:gas vesicle protein n=1 Tax=Dactylosporangium sp. NPDC049525 TaxID=3154730 RepID=UPI0034308EA0
MTSRDTAMPVSAAVAPDRLALVDLLDRVLATGVVISGEVTLSIADVDLVTISLRALVSSVGTLSEDAPP